MKILFVSDQYGAANNGVTISARRYAEALRARGHEVRVLSTNNCEETGYRVHEMRLPVFDKLIKSQGMIFGRAEKDVIRGGRRLGGRYPFLYAVPALHRRRADRKGGGQARDLRLSRTAAKRLVLDRHGEVGVCERFYFSGCSVRSFSTASGISIVRAALSRRNSKRTIITPRPG